MNYKETIENIIEQVLTEKTFNLDIVGKIKELKEGFDILIEEKVSNLETLNARNIVIGQLENKFRTEREKVVAYEAREKVISEKEKKFEKNEYELGFQTKRADEIKELFSIVFRNPVLKESIYRNGSIPVGQNGYISNQSTNESEQKTTQIE